MTISSIGQNQYMYNLLSKLSSGKRINSAADDPAGLAISQRMNSQANIYRVQNNNIADSQNLLTATDGGLSSISSNLQRMRELAVQASNGTYSDSDKAALQKEVDQLKSQIDSTSFATQFNGIQTLNGTRLELNETRPLTFKSTVESLGLKDFNVEGNIDMDALDKAIEQVSDMRSGIGAATNGLTHTSNSNSVAEINTIAAQSRIEDADIAKLVMEFRKTSLFQQVNIMTQRKTQQNSQSFMGGLMGMLR